MKYQADTPAFWEGTNQTKVQMHRANIVAEFTAPKKHLKIRITRKPGDRGLIGKTFRVLNIPTSSPASRLQGVTAPSFFWCNVSKRGDRTSIFHQKWRPYVFGRGGILQKKRQTGKITRKTLGLNGWRHKNKIVHRVWKIPNRREARKSADPPAHISLILPLRVIVFRATPSSLSSLRYCGQTKTGGENGKGCI